MAPADFTQSTQSSYPPAQSALPGCSVSASAGSIGFNFIDAKFGNAALKKHCKRNKIINKLKPPDHPTKAIDPNEQADLQQHGLTLEGAVLLAQDRQQWGNLVHQRINAGRNTAGAFVVFASAQFYNLLWPHQS